MSAGACCRPVGQIMSPYAVYSGDQGLITSDQDVILVLVFSEPVTGLTAGSFSVSGPSGATVSGLKLLRGTNTYYHFVVNLPGIYYDSVTVSLSVSSSPAGLHGVCTCECRVLPFGVASCFVAASYRATLMYSCQAPNKPGCLTARPEKSHFC